jgi:hypothetical protein
MATLKGRGMFGRGMANPSDSKQLKPEGPHVKGAKANLIGVAVLPVSANRRPAAFNAAYQLGALGVRLLEQCSGSE